MGNTEATNGGMPRYEEQQDELDLSRHVNQQQYTKHNLGVYSERCLTSLPWNLVDSVYLHKSLKVSFNCLTSVPEELPLRLPHLTHLDISHNQLLTLPESIALFYHLNTLLLQHNCIESLPQSFIKLNNLTKLDISHNNLEELPAGIGHMKSLVKLNVSHNKIRKLPLTLAGSATLKLLLASNNKCRMPPQSTCNLSSAATLEYMNKLLVHPVCKENGVGHSSVGNVFTARVRGNVLHLITSTHAEEARSQFAQKQTRTSDTISRVKTPLMPPPHSTIYTAAQLSDKVLGLIYGAAVGDAFGLATEHLSKDECDFYYEIDSLSCETILQDSHRVKYKKGDWTTNFDQLVLVLDSLIHWAGMVDELEFAQRFHHWHQLGFPELGDVHGTEISDYVSKVVSSPTFLTDPHNASRAVHKMLQQECGQPEHLLPPHTAADASMLLRCIILGVVDFHNTSEVIRNVERICLCTHPDARCLAAAVSLTVMVAKLLQRAPIARELDKWLEDVAAAGLSYLSDESDRAEFIASFSVTSFDDVDIQEPGKVFYAFKPVACAVAALRDEGMNYRDVVSRLIMLGGGSTGNASACGAVVGLVSGYSGLPADWLNQLRSKHCDWLNHKVNLLLDMMALP